MASAPPLSAALYVSADLRDGEVRIRLHDPPLATDGATPSVKPRPPANVRRGAFILFEGLDRSGKTTQCAMLAKYLLTKAPPAAAASPDAKVSAQPVVDATATATAAATATATTAPAAVPSPPPGAIAMRFPARQSAVGRVIDAYLTSKQSLSDQAIHLLFAANRWEHAQQIRAALLAGQHVVMDRYSYSGIAYSIAKGLTESWCAASEVGLPAPDLVITLSVTPAEATKRGGYGTERYETQGFQEKVAAAFQHMFDAKMCVSYTGNDLVDTRSGCLWANLSGMATVEAIHALCVSHAEHTIARVRDDPIGML